MSAEERRQIEREAERDEQHTRQMCRLFGWCTECAGNLVEGKCPKGCQERPC